MDEMKKLYDRLVKEHESTIDYCETLRKGKVDYSPQWQYASGLFLAIKQIHNLLGYQ